MESISPVITLSTDKKNRALFLDRDGVINKDTHFLYKIDEVIFVDGIFDLCLSAQQRGYIIVIITNQSGIARGYYTEKDYKILMRWMNVQFVEQGITVTDTFYCPHHPTSGLRGYKKKCNCRKPSPGMIISAMNKYNIDLQASLFVGDRVSDMFSAQAACVGQKILFRASNNFDSSDVNIADKVIDNLTDAIKFL